MSYREDGEIRTIPEFIGWVADKLLLVVGVISLTISCVFLYDTVATYFRGIGG